MDVSDGGYITLVNDVCLTNWSDTCNVTRAPHDEFVGEPMSMTVLVIVGGLHGVSIVNGVLGNGLLLVALLTDKPFRALSKTYSVYLVNLALADLYLLAYYYPMLLLGFVLGRYPAHNHTHCVLTAFLASVSYLTFIATILLITLDRYVRLHNNRCYRACFSRRNGTMACVAAWLISALIFLPALLTGSYGFSRKLHTCQYKEASNRPDYAHMLTIVLFIFIVSIYFVLNLLIYKSIRNTRRRHLRDGEMSPVSKDNDRGERPAENIQCLNTPAELVQENKDRLEYRHTRPARTFLSLDTSPETFSESVHQHLTRNTSDTCGHMTGSFNQNNQTHQGNTNGTRHLAGNLNQARHLTTILVPAVCSAAIAGLAQRELQDRLGARASLTAAPNQTSRNLPEIMVETPLVTRDTNPATRHVTDSQTSSSLLPSVYPAAELQDRPRVTGQTSSGIVHVFYARSKENEAQLRQWLPFGSDIALLRSVFCMFVCMVVCLVPIGAVRVCETFDRDVPVGVYAVCMWLLSFNSSVSWIVYGLSNARFRYTYKRVLSSCRTQGCC